MPGVVESIEGISPYQVFQRNAKDVARIAFTGVLTREMKGLVEARVRKGTAEVLPWHPVGKAVGRSFSGEIKHIPTGGEYSVELRFPDGSIHTIRHIMAGDLWILAGQSNMDGCAKQIGLEPPGPKVHCFYMDDRWGIARDPLITRWNAVDPVHRWMVPEDKLADASQWERYFNGTAVGLGVRFGKEMVRHTGVPVGLIPCSYGGTCMDQWNPALKDKGGNSLYGAMIRRINALGGKAAGCLWYQGESDGQPNAWPVYKEKFRNLIESLRKDINQPELPFIYAQLAVYYGDANAIPNWNEIQWEQFNLEKEMKNVAMAATADLSLCDIIHVDTAGLRTLGARMAVLARVLRFNEKGLALGPRPAEFSFEPDRQRLTIRFKGVNGVLKRVPRVQGFWVEDTVPVPIVYSKVSGNQVTLRFMRPVGEKATLCYGKGHNPVTNLIDSAGLPVPVFGPVNL